MKRILIAAFVIIALTASVSAQSDNTLGLKAGVNMFKWYGDDVEGLDYLTAEAAVDSAANVWVSFDINDKINVKARYETVSFEAAGVDDSSRTTLYASYAINDNLSAALESSTGSTDDVVADAISGIVDDGVTTLEFIGTF